MQANKFYKVKDNIFVSRHEEILQDTIVYCRYIDNLAYIYNKDNAKLLIILYNNNLHEVLEEL